MSNLGPVEYEEDTGNPFLGRDYSKNKNHSDKVGFEIDREVRELLTDAKIKAVEIIKKHTKLLELISETLLEKETIVKEEIDYINKHMKKPPVTKISKTRVNTNTLSDLISEVGSTKPTSKKVSSKSVAKKTNSKK
jgi:cell division protease FtsH